MNKFIFSFFDKQIKKAEKQISCWGLQRIESFENSVSVDLYMWKKNLHLSMFSPSKYD